MDIARIESQPQGSSGFAEIKLCSEYKVVRMPRSLHIIGARSMHRTEYQGTVTVEALYLGNDEGRSKVCELETSTINLNLILHQSKGIIFNTVPHRYSHHITLIGVWFEFDMYLLSMLPTIYSISSDSGAKIVPWSDHESAQVYDPVEIKLGSEYKFVHMSRSLHIIGAKNTNRSEHCDAAVVEALEVGSENARSEVCKFESDASVKLNIIFHKGKSIIFNTVPRHFGQHITLIGIWF